MKWLPAALTNTVPLPYPASPVDTPKASTCVGVALDALTSQMPVLVTANSLSFEPPLTLPVYGSTVRTSLFPLPVNPVHHSDQPSRVRRPNSAATMFHSRMASVAGKIGRAH